MLSQTWGCDYFIKIVISFSLCKYPRKGIVGSYGSSIFNFFKLKYSQYIYIYESGVQYCDSQFLKVIFTFIVIIKHWLYFLHWKRKWQPTSVFLPGESQGWRSLVGCRTRLKQLSSSRSSSSISCVVEYILVMYLFYT